MAYSTMLKVCINLGGLTDSLVNFGCVGNRALQIPMDAGTLVIIPVLIVRTSILYYLLCLFVILSHSGRNCPNR